jgi:hypothetical protein
MPRRREDAKRWLRRAEDVRNVAATLKDDTAKREMLEIAEGYERLAKQVERRTPK